MSRPHPLGVAWLDALPGPEAMRAADAAAIAAGTPGSVLMDRAGHALADLADAVLPPGPVAVLCGSGNNGGDGYVAASALRAQGRREVRVIATKPVAELEGDARRAADQLPGAGPVPPEDAAAALDGVVGVVDCLLGTGFAGEVRGAVAELIAAVDERGLPAVSADVPSGVDAATGEVAGAAITATATATFAAAKPGLRIAPGKAHAGVVHVIDIGLGDGHAADVGLITPRVLDALPERGASSTKFSSGHVLVTGGSRGLTGAPLMASQAAARAGAGYVTLALPASVQWVGDASMLEVMSQALPDADGHHVPDGVQPVLEATRGQGALVLGPGLGRADDVQAFAREVARRAEVALVLDADGLNAHAGRIEDLAAREAPTVLTPHAGELGRLLERDSHEVGAHRLATAREAAERSGAIVVLKGDDTLVAHPDGRVAVSPGGAPALATAGTGDVLSGVVAAFLASGMDPWEAASAAVWAHVRAGQIAARPHGPRGVVATDVIAALPEAVGPTPPTELQLRAQ